MFTSQPCSCIIMMNQCISWSLFDQKQKFNNSIVFFFFLTFYSFILGCLHCNEYDSPEIEVAEADVRIFHPQPLVIVIKVSELDGREIGDAWNLWQGAFITLWQTDRLPVTRSSTAVMLLCCGYFPSASRHSWTQFMVPWEIW